MKPQSEQQAQPKTVTRCSYCNEAVYLELRNDETRELVVYRCPHTRELITAAEKRLKAYRV